MLGCGEAEKAEELEPLVVIEIVVRGVSDDDGVATNESDGATTVEDGQRETEGEPLGDRLKRDDSESRTLRVEVDVTVSLAETEREPVGETDGDVDSDAAAFEAVSMAVELGVDETEDVIDADTLPEMDVDALIQIETVCVVEAEVDRHAEPVTDSVPVTDPRGEDDFAEDTEGRMLTDAQFDGKELLEVDGVARADELDDPLVLTPAVCVTDFVPPIGDADVLPVSDVEPELLVEARALVLPPANEDDGLLVDDALDDAADVSDGAGGAVSVELGAREDDRSAVVEAEKVPSKVVLGERDSCTVAVLPNDVVGESLLDAQTVADVEIDAETDKLRDGRRDAEAHGVTVPVRVEAREIDCAALIES